MGSLLYPYHGGRRDLQPDAATDLENGSRGGRHAQRLRAPQRTDLIVPVLAEVGTIDDLRFDRQIGAAAHLGRQADRLRPQRVEEPAAAAGALERRCSRRETVEAHVAALPRPFDEVGPADEARHEAALGPAV